MWRYLLVCLIYSGLIEASYCLTLDEALDRARSGFVDSEVVNSFREYQKSYLQRVGKSPTSSAHAANYLIASLIDLSKKGEADRVPLLVEAVIRCQAILAQFPQDKSTQEYYETSKKLLFTPRIQRLGVKAHTDYDFVEIGTSDYDCVANQPEMARKRGVSVEPVPYYYQKLENTIFHQKIQAAIVEDSAVEFSRSVYFVNPILLEEHNEWPEWIRGCNSLDKPHSVAVGFLNGQGIDPSIHIHSVQVPAMTMSTLMRNISACRIEFLKTDVEGFDPVILMSYAMYLLENPKCYANRIQLETNEQSSSASQTRFFRFISLLGYTVGELDGSNVILQYDIQHDHRHSKVGL